MPIESSGKLGLAETATKSVVQEADVSRRFPAKPDSAGRFDPRLPGIKSAHLNLSADGVDAQMEYRSAPIKDVRLERH